MNWNIDDNGIMRIYNGNAIVAEICECGSMNKKDAEQLAIEIYEERRK